MHLTPKRTIVFWGETVTTYTMKDIRNKLEGFLDDDPEAWITLEILSIGGECVAGFALYDWIIAHEKMNLQTVAIGQVQSMAVILFLAGKHRVATSNASFYLHQTMRQYKDNQTLNISDHLQAIGSLQDDLKCYRRIFRERVPNAPSNRELEKIMIESVMIRSKKALKWGIVHEVTE